MSDGGELKIDSEDGTVRIPMLLVSLIGVLLVQTGGAIWWASSISADQNTIKQSVQQIRVDSYTRAEASLQVQRLDQMDVANNQRLGEITSRLDRIEFQQRLTKEQQR